MDKENYKNLYRRYLEFKKKILKAHIGKITGTYEVQYFPQKDRDELNKIKEELLNYLEVLPNVLSNNELMRISEEIDEVGRKAGTILEKRFSLQQSGTERQDNIPGKI